MEITTLEQANDIRQRLLAGEEMSREILASTILFLRVNRAAAPAAKETKAKATKGPAVSLMSVLQALKENGGGK